VEPRASHIVSGSKSEGITDVPPDLPFSVKYIVEELPMLCAILTDTDKTINIKIRNNILFVLNIAPPF
jgi:hypothetical protein